jgi:predicted nucleic acid-binding protein
LGHRLGRPESRENPTVSQLIEDDRVVVIGPVLAEVLVGFRRPEQADWTASRLRKLSWFAIDWDDWREAAALGRQVAASRQRLPLTDLVIAAIARRHDLAVYTVDPHFDRFADLERFQ